MSSPIITIITPCFNGATTIERCISSIRNQSYEFIEHLIIDGGSNDETIKILDALKAKYVSEPDAGIYDAINKGIRLSSGNIIGIINCDDYLAHAQVVEQVVVAMTEKSADLFHAKIEQIDELGRHIWTVGCDIDKKSLLKKMRVAHPSVFVCKDVYRKYGGFSPGYRIAGDYEFLLRVWGKVKVIFSEDIVVKMSMAGISNTQASKGMRESLSAQILHGDNILMSCYWYVLNRVVHAAVIYARRYGLRR